MGSWQEISWGQAQPGALHGHEASAAPNYECFWGGGGTPLLGLLRGSEMCCEHSRHLSDPGNRSRKKPFGRKHQRHSKQG